MHLKKDGEEEQASPLQALPCWAGVTSGPRTGSPSPRPLGCLRGVRVIWGDKFEMVTPLPRGMIPPHAQCLLSFSCMIPPSCSEMGLPGIIIPKLQMRPAAHVWGGFKIPPQPGAQGIPASKERAGPSC